MNIDSIKSTIKAIPSQAKGVADTVGKTSISYATTAGNYISQHAPESLKNIKTLQTVDTFVQTAKEKAPEFVKTGAKFVKGHKETFIGGAVILAAAGCAFSIIKGIVNKIKQSKQEAN